MSERRAAGAAATPDREWVDLLRRNVGFEDPVRWVDFARSHSFRHVPATPVEACPDCGARPGAALGQYVHYSTLIRLRPCPACGLVFSDVHLDAAVVKAHFERSYKGDAYFSGMRLAIFESIAAEVAARAPGGGRVLDVGGAEGHLLARIRELRPDLQLEAADVSEEACRVARQRGFHAVPTSIADLARRDESFDVVLLIDVAYYEPDVRALWRAVDRLVAPSGLLLIRVPNKLPWIRLGTTLQRRLHRVSPRRPQARVPFFNPEHVLVFSRRYLERRLASLGFRVAPQPSPLLARRAFTRPLLEGVHRTGRVLSHLPGSPVCTPSMLVVAERSERTSH